MTREAKPQRSWMIVPAHDAERRAQAAELEPDAIVLDLVNTPGVDWQADLRSRMPSATHAAWRGDRSNT